MVEKWNACKPPHALPRMPHAVRTPTNGVRTAGSACGPAGQACWPCTPVRPGSRYRGTLIRVLFGTLIRVPGYPYKGYLGTLIRVPGYPYKGTWRGTLIRVPNGTLIRVPNGTLIRVPNGTLIRVPFGTLIRVPFEAYVSRQACKACTPVRRACRLCTPFRQACRLCTPARRMHAYCRHAHGVQRAGKGVQPLHAFPTRRAAAARLSKAACSGCTPFFLGVQIGVRTPKGRAAIKPPM
ncbi:hypothetical protein PCANC_04989 [Puccinia coronata f. sp. avenae]|uniref:Uncharacterized protein n=1 Tax=Puccinia coronata f. sp. avenae TaxID=200324 RepID=A0A2N5T7S1_9BASI|nr:hypothetical protein PCANC_04989 [Puccinia coronata f. sp. avenae]